MGTYHTTAPIETFTVAHSTQHPTDLAGLMGARLATATEIEEGRAWTESKLKAIIGGDEISARIFSASLQHSN
jgi:putative DNA primase/helicase